MAVRAVHRLCYALTALSCLRHQLLHSLRLKVARCNGRAGRGCNRRLSSSSVLRESRAASALAHSLALSPPAPPRIGANEGNAPTNNDIMRTIMRTKNECTHSLVLLALCLALELMLQPLLHRLAEPWPAREENALFSRVLPCVAAHRSMRGNLGLHVPYSPLSVAPAEETMRGRPKAHGLRHGLRRRTMS